MLTGARQDVNELVNATDTPISTISQGSRGHAQKSGARGNQDDKIAAMKKLYLEGCSLSQLGAEFRMSPNTARKKLVAAGVKMRTPKEAARIVSQWSQKRKKSSRRMCSCCGLRPVPKRPVCGVQLTRLCAFCYKHAEQDGV